MTTSTIDDELIEFVAGFEKDPYGFVLAAFDWQVGELANHTGPDEWQRTILQHITEKAQAGASRSEAVQIAITSGHGSGKSALVSWVILWAMSTAEDTKCVITANTERQLQTKTIAEVAKWHRLCITRDWFTMTATAMFSADKTHEKTWRADFVPWSETNTEAFAGLHAQGKRILLVFDEASSIADAVWEVAEGALTDKDTEIVWLVCGNPTRNVGRFRECFGKNAHRWFTHKVDTSKCRMTNKSQIQKWVADHGWDSDFVRVRVRGEFPLAAMNALLGPEEVAQAVARKYQPNVIEGQAVVLGVDVARQGEDSSVIARRQGLVAFPLQVMRIPDTMQVANQVLITSSTHTPDAVFVDATGGYGVGVVDAMRQRNADPIEVYFSGKADDPRFFNKRTEMMFRLAEWVRRGGALPDDPELAEELAATIYSYQGDKFRLASKDEIKQILGRSPDKADALALTFAYPVAARPRVDGVVFPSFNKPRHHDPYAADLTGGGQRRKQWDPYS